MLKKQLSIVLVLIMLIGMSPVFTIPASATTGDDDISDMNALDALGIDTSIPPEGFDPNSTENPYGTDVVPLGTVWELYTVGLTTKALYKSPNTSNSNVTHDDIEGNLIRYTESNYNLNMLQSNLYGSSDGSYTKVSDVLGSKIDSNVASGETTQTANYVHIGNGTDSSGNDNGTGGNYMTSVNGLSTSLTNSADSSDTFDYAMSSVASANFNGNKESKQAQTVMAYTSNCSANGGLFLRFGDTTGNYGTSSIELIPTTKKIGNPALIDADNNLVEDFAANPYQLKNYLQVATGDWDNNGVDEVAVYVPEHGYSRILIYKFNGLGTDKDAGGLYTSDAYTNIDRWSLAWSYYLNEGDVVSNMVSLTSGDVNRDGVDDLAATWGYYYGSGQNKGSRAVVMFGGTDKNMLKSSQEFSLVHGSSNIVRAAFTYGDLAGSGEECLILCGQSDSDLKAGNLNTRYVALYNWNGTQFTYNVNKNFDLFSTNSDGNLIYTAMIRDKVEGKYIHYSSPLCVSNIAVVSQGITQKTSALYFDSLLIEYTDSGLDIAEAWDDKPAMQTGISPASYVEYDAVGGDLTGQTGAGMVATMQQTIGDTSEIIAPYLASGLVPYYEQDWYYKNWWFRLWGWKTYFWYYAGMRNVDSWTSDTVAVYKPGKTYMVVVSPNEGDGAHYIGEVGEDGEDVSAHYKRTETDLSMTICLANTDSDTSYMKYTNKHHFLYTDPAVLAALASPPYFSDLLNRDDLSGNYAESATSYSSTTGSGGGSTTSTTLTVGAYVSFEHDVLVFGVKVASVEAEATVTAGFTWDTEETSTLEQTITYNATAGEDMIAFYSIPMEIFEYITYTPDGNGGYTEVVTTVNIPHEAAVRLLSLSEYEMIAADYDVLPKISDTVMTHTVGDPTLYPKPSEVDETNKKYNGYELIAAYDGDPLAVGYSSNAGGASVTQEIAMSEENSSAFTISGGLDTKAGAGVGDFTVGIVAGIEGGAGEVTITTEGSSFSGDMQNMPIEAQEFGYKMNWRIFSYAYKDSNTSFPVVSYIVSDVTMPPTLPVDFDQSVADTTDTSATLTWTYNKMVTAFKIYRYYEFPEGSGSHLIATVPFSAATGYDVTTGTYSFSYTEKNLSPYTDYVYQIQTVGIGDQNNVSIYSEPITIRTKTALGYPVITVNGLDDGTLLLYPDSPSTVEVAVAMRPEDKARGGEYKSISYKWQRITNGNWKDIDGATKSSYLFRNTSASDATSYRCRLNIIYYDEISASQYYISAYSQAFTTAYSKRTSTGDLAVTVNNNTLTAKAQLWSANTGHKTAPTGTITVTVNGILSDNTTYDFSKTVLLATDGSQYMDGVEKDIYSGTLELTGLKSGVYMVSYTYNGNRYFKSYTLGDSEVGIVGSGSTYQLGLTDSNEANAKAQVAFTYGSKIYPTMSLIEKNMGGVATKTDFSNISMFAYSSNGSEWTDFTPGSMTPSVGTYTMRATHGENTAIQIFTVTPRDITIEMPTYPNVSAVNVLSTQPVAQLAEGSTMAEGETFAMDSDSASNTAATLRLGYFAYNSAGTLMPLEATTTPGNYTIIGCKSSSSNDVQNANYENYNITYAPGVYTITGATYYVEVVASNYSDTDGSRVVGTANISNGGSIAYYPSGSTVTLVANPHEGYRVKKWEAKFKSNDVVRYNDANHKDYDGATDLTSLFLKTEAQNVTVTVTFERANNTLATSVSEGGTVQCDDSNFTNGSYAYLGGEFNFTATPAAGYSFSRWVVYAATTSYATGTDNGDGTNTLHFKMGAANTNVHAIFVRDSYTLTLDGNIRAWYMKPGQTTTDPAVKTYITSGSSVAGSNVITVEPKLGYSKDGDWTIDGNTITASDDTYTVTDNTCEFTLASNTTVFLETAQGSFDVRTSAEHGSVAIAVDDIAKEGALVSGVLGGSKVTLTAKAHRGYVFDHWTIDGEDFSDLTDLEKENVTETINTSGSAQLTIARLEAAKVILPVFSANTPYTFTASLNNTGRGALTFTLKNIYGDITTANCTYTNSFTVYNGESVRLMVTPSPGNMVEHWVVNNVSSASTDKYKDFNNISVDTTVEVQLKASTGYKVLYSTGDNGSLISHEADDKDFASGDILSGGAKISLTASPVSGYMVEKWTRIVGLNSEVEVVVTDADGVNLIDPIYTTYLDGHYQYKAYFTAASEHNVSTADITGGTGDIIYATPLVYIDDGTVSNTTDYAVRNGGTVKIKFTASDGYATDAVYLQNVLSGCGQVVNITELDRGKEYVAEIKNVSGELTISTLNPFYPLCDISLASDPNGSLAITGVTTAIASDYYVWSAAAATVRSGADTVIALTLSPNTGYEVESVTVNGESVTTTTYVNEGVSDIMTVSFNTADYSAGVSGQDVTVAVTYKGIAPYSAVSYGPLIKSGEDSGHGSVGAVVGRKNIAAYAETGETNSSVNVYRDGQVILTAIPDTGYKFVSWTIDGTEVGSAAAPAGVTVTGRSLMLDITASSNNSYEITALFELAGDKVTFSAENDDMGDTTIHGTVSAYSSATEAEFVSGAKLAVSSTLTFTAIPETGYHVKGWYRNGVLDSGSSNTYDYYYDVTLDNPGADIVVKFIRDSYTVSYSATSGTIMEIGTIKTGSEQIIGDTIMTLTAVPDDGYAFVRWMVNGQGAGENATLNVTVTADASIHAIFEPQSNTFSVTYSADSNGTLRAADLNQQNIPSGAARAAESTVVFTATPSTGYQVKGWVVNGTELSNSSEKKSYTISSLLASATVFVEFEPIPTYKITLNAYRHGTVTAKVNGTDRAIENGILLVSRHENVVLTAKPSTHYAFVGWGDDGSNTDTPLTIDDVTGNMSISPNFTAAEYLQLTVSREDSNGNIILVKTLSDGEEKNITATVGTQVEIVAGSTVTIVAEPGIDYMVKSWKVNDSAVANISETEVLTNILTDTTVKVAFEEYIGWTIPTGSSDTFFTATTISRTPDDTTPATEIRDRGTATFKISINANFVLTSLKVNGYECMINDTTDYGSVSIMPNSDSTYNVTVSNVTAEIEVTATEFKLQPSPGPGNTQPEDITQLTTAAENHLSGQVQTSIYTVSLLNKNASGEWDPLDNEEEVDNIIRARGSVDLYLPYPDGITYATSEGFEFSVAHLITSGPNAGKIEHLIATPTPEGLRVTITSLSPFALSYAPKYKITFNVAANAGSGVTSYQYTVSNGKLLSLPIASKTGYSFTGWFTEASGGTQITTSTVFTLDTEVFAQFAPINSGGGTPAPVTVYVKTTVNDVEYDIGTESTSGSATVLMIDKELLGELLSEIDNGSSVLLPISSGKDTSIVSMTIGDLERLAAKNTQLSVSVGGLSYMIDTKGLDTATILEMMGAADPDQITLEISIVRSNVETQTAAKKDIESNGATVVVEPIEFSITAFYQDKSNSMTYSTFMTRSIEVSAEQSARITTAIVYQADGTSYHVPTAIRTETINGVIHYYADIASLHDSTYILIHNEKSFADAEGKWYKEFVNEMASRKIVGGRDDGLFYGDDCVTRAEFTAIIIRALGLESLKSDEASRFSDVNSNAWYFNNVGIAYQYGIIGGTSATTFNPDANITREDAMLIIQRACSIVQLNEGNKDYSKNSGINEVSTYAKDAVIFNLKTGLIEGDSTGYVNARGNITRSESATIVLRMMRMSGLFNESSPE